jgi:branched-chain amino acid aminotransferase
VESLPLPGIAREVLLEAGHVGLLPVVERSISLRRLADASACFFTNSAVLATGVPLAEEARTLIEVVARREA